MTMPYSGAISLGQLRTELGGSGPISMNSVNARIAAGNNTPSTQVKISDYYRVKIYTVTVGQNGGGTQWGWWNIGGGFGSCTPTDYKGQTIVGIFTVNNPDNYIEASFVWGFAGLPTPPTRVTTFRSNNTLGANFNTTAAYNTSGGFFFHFPDVGTVQKVAVKES